MTQYTTTDECTCLSVPDGVYNVLPTPFCPNTGKINIDSFTRLVEYQLTTPVTGLVVLGTTGEVPTLSPDEKMMLTELVYNMIRNSGTKKKLVVGVGGNNTNEVRNFVKQVKHYADVIMATVPSYNKPCQDGMLLHFGVVATTCSDKPVMLYNVPSRTGSNLLPETVHKLCLNYPNIVALKEASGDLEQIKTVIKLCPTLSVFSGNDDQTLEIMQMGGKGLISVVSNILPELTVRIVNEQSTVLNDKLQELLVMMNKICKPNPVPIKYLLYKLGYFDTDYCRLPLVSMTTIDTHEYPEMVELAKKLR